MKALVLATRNPGKVKEFRSLLAEVPLVVQSAADLRGAPDVEEDAPTLEGNAEKKAWALHRFSGQPSLADDTGLEVDALEGRPGVHSARFAGPQASDAENRAHLLQALTGVAHRRARFRTVLALATDTGLRLFEGVCTGTILTTERGTGGFGYDPLFVPDGSTRTFAEMTSVEKNQVSHRARALAAFLAHVRHAGVPS
ncbi:MAG: RdgB/HAM1 family non-canonical purine NTP pyrophosphatase [Bacteroidota bacterium]